MDSLCEGLQFAVLEPPPATFCKEEFLTLCFEGLATRIAKTVMEDIRSMNEEGAKNDGDAVGELVDGSPQERGGDGRECEEEAQGVTPMLAGAAAASAQSSSSDNSDDDDTAGTIFLSAMRIVGSLFKVRSSQQQQKQQTDHQQLVKTHQPPHEQQGR